MENTPMETPKEDLRRDALEHYEEAGNAIHHHRSDIPKAIKEYYEEKENPKLYLYWGLGLGVVYGVVSTLIFLDTDIILSYIFFFILSALIGLIIRNFLL